MLHQISFILSIIVAVITFFCLVLPEWIHVNIYMKDSKEIQGMTAGLFYSCDVGDGSLRWGDCGRGRYLFMPWYILVASLYTIAVILAVVSVPVHYYTTRSSKGSTLYRAAPTALTFIALGFQIVVLGLYGDHYDSQSWCILRYSDVQREICTAHFDHHLTRRGETVNLGWVYWIALVGALVSAANSILDYFIVNDEVELS